MVRLWCVPLQLAAVWVHLEMREISMHGMAVVCSSSTCSRVGIFGEVWNLNAWCGCLHFLSQWCGCTFSRSRRMISLFSLMVQLLWKSSQGCHCTFSCSRKMILLIFLRVWLHLLMLQKKNNLALLLKGAVAPKIFSMGLGCLIGPKSGPNGPCVIKGA